MEESRGVTAVKQMRRLVNELLSLGFSESQIKKISACAIIAELLERMSPQEKDKFLSDSDFFSSYIQSNIPDTQWGIDNILYREHIYGSGQTKSSNAFLHRYNDFLE